MFPDWLFYPLLALVLVGLVGLMRAFKDEKARPKKEAANKAAQEQWQRYQRGNAYAREWHWQQNQVRGRGRAGQRLHGQRKRARQRQQRESERWGFRDGRWSWDDEGGDGS